MPAATTRRRRRPPPVAVVAVVALVASSLVLSSVALRPPPAAATPSQPADRHQPVTSAATVGAGASFSELVALATTALGPTDDLTAAIASLDTLAADIPTPADASLDAFAIDHDAALEARFTVATAATIDDLAEFYLAQMLAAGAELVDERSLRGGAPRELTFVAPDLDDGHVVVTVSDDDAATGQDESSGATATISITAPDTGAADAFSAFAAPMAGLGGDAAEAAGSGFAARLDRADDDRPAAVVSVTATFEYADATADDLREALIADLPVAGFALIGDDSDSTVALDHPYLREVDAAFATTPDGATLTITATTRVEL